MSYTVNFVATFQNQPSLTLNAILYDAANPTPTQIGPTITTGFTNLGYGSYSFWATLPDGHVGAFVIFDADNLLRRMAFAINPAELELNAIADAIMRRGRAHSDGNGVADYGSLYELLGGGLQSETIENVWNIYASDGVTVFNTRDLTLDANVLPVKGIA